MKKFNLSNLIDVILLFLCPFYIMQILNISLWNAFMLCITYLCFYCSLVSVGTNITMFIVKKYKEFSEQTDAEKPEDPEETPKKSEE